MGSEERTGPVAIAGKGGEPIAGGVTDAAGCRPAEVEATAGKGGEPDEPDVRIGCPNVELAVGSTGAAVPVPLA